MNLWEKVGNISDVGGTSIWDTDDYGVMVGEEPIFSGLYITFDDKVGILEEKTVKQRNRCGYAPLAIVERHREI